MEPSLTTLKLIEALKLKSQKKRNEKKLVVRWLVQVCQKESFIIYKIFGGGLIFALHMQRIRAHLFEHYKHLTSMLKPYKEKEAMQAFSISFPQALGRCMCEGLSH
jgi:hypothetical protein